MNRKPEHDRKCAKPFLTLNSSCSEKGDGRSNSGAQKGSVSKITILNFILKDSH